MKSQLMIGIILMAWCMISTAQEEQLEVEGAIQIGNSVNPAPDPGTIRWTGSDFLGWNGFKWVSLTTGIAFGEEVSDIDGNVYQTINIGTQTWMAENLRTSKYADGLEILKVTDNLTWAGLSIGAFCWYNNDSTTYEQAYGKLYNWFAVNDLIGLCPSGWHVPSDADWTQLIVHLDPGAVVVDGAQSSIAGAKMKEKGFAHWVENTSGATNESGFTAYPGGFRSYFDGVFFDLSIRGTWWSATSSSVNEAWERSLIHFTASIDRGLGRKKEGLSVRCIKN